MKKINFLFILLLVCLNSREQTNVVGFWEGKMVTTFEIRVAFHFKQEPGNNLYVSIDLPDQGVKGYESNAITIAADSLIIQIKEINARYAGKFVNDSTIAGNWIQGTAIPLNIKKANKIVKTTRSQTPQPPFNYVSEDMVYFNSDKTIQYGATITLPKGAGPFPAAILITGSGQQNRDEEAFGHRPFAVIADYLTNRGFVVLRVDDRGTGKTTGELLQATSLDFAKDVSVGIDYLKSRKEVDKKKIGMIGHSEGGMIAQMLAASRKDIDFIISLAGPGEKIQDLMVEQNCAILKAHGMSAEYVEQYAKLYSAIIAAAADTSGEEQERKGINAYVDTWLKETPKNAVMATTGITDEKSKEAFINTCIKSFNIPWLKYFIRYNPGPILKELHCKFLGLNGEKDLQVLSKSNLAAMEASLKLGKSSSWEVKELPGLNHLFQTCATCTLKEYGELAETISPVALETIGQWLTMHVQKNNSR